MGAGRRHVMVWLLHIGIRIHAAVGLGGGVAVRMTTGVWLVRLLELLLLRIQMHIHTDVVPDERTDRLLR